MNASHDKPSALQWCILAAFVGTSVVGCAGSEELGQVNGQVTFQNAPVTNGTIVFEDSSRGISVRARFDAEGCYHVQTYDQDGLPPGKYMVAVTPTEIGSGKSPFVGGAEERSARPTGPEVPAKYHNVTTSELSAEVKKGPNVFDFHLK